MSSHVDSPSKVELRPLKLDSLLVIALQEDPIAVENHNFSPFCESILRVCGVKNAESSAVVVLRPGSGGAELSLTGKEASLQTLGLAALDASSSS